MADLRSGGGSWSRLTILAMGAVVLAACSGAGVGSTAAPPTAQATVATTALPQPSAAVASPSGAGATGGAVLGDIIYTTKPGGVGGSDTIYAMDPTGARPLRKILYHGWFPDLRPDGSLIAYTSAVGDGAMDIYTMRPDGSDVTQVTDPLRLVGPFEEVAKDDLNQFWPRWSPDGTKLLFMEFESGLNVTDAEGADKVLVATDASPGTWSPDGKHIAYGGGPDEHGDLWVVDQDGKNAVDITNSPSVEALPSYSPDGNKIAFVSDKSGQADIYVMDADGSDVTQLTDDPDDEDAPAWSPDGKLIAYGRAANQDGSFGDIWVMNADGTGQRNLTNSPNDDDFVPVWR